MIRGKIHIIYADTWDDLTVKMLGYYHDHCWHHYAGLTNEMPEDLIEKIKNYGNKHIHNIDAGEIETQQYCEFGNYVFICEEDELIKSN